MFDEIECFFVCGYIASSIPDIKKHLYLSHNIKAGSYYYCSDCEYKTKDLKVLKKHLWVIHDKGKDGVINKCPHCSYSTKRSLHTHLTRVHDIGNKCCDYCNKNVFEVICYHDKNSGMVKICRTCYGKITGYTTKKEKQMVNYVSKTEFAGYIVQTNSVIKGKNCNTKRRPDLILSSSRNLMVIIECDENAHLGYNPQCEWSRMHEILDELPDIRSIFIRWNPDSFKLKGVKQIINRTKRLEILVNLIRKLSNKKWCEKDSICVIYMFYPDNSKNFIPTLPKKFIYNMDDIDTF